MNRDEDSNGESNNSSDLNQAEHVHLLQFDKDNNNNNNNDSAYSCHSSVPNLDDLYVNYIGQFGLGQLLPYFMISCGWFIAAPLVC